VRVDEKAWSDALLKAGAAEAAEELRERAGDLLEEHGGKELEDKASDVLDGLLKKKKKDDPE
jgi:hypothetical protein